MERLKIAIVFGGASREHQVSVSSARSVMRFFPINKYDLTAVYITKEGRWLHCPDITELCEDDNWFEKGEFEEVTISLNPQKKGFYKVNSGTDTYITADCVFPVLHGRFGEDGTLQGIFEMAQMPYVGCGVASSAMAMDKDLTHRIMEAAGIRTAKWHSVINSNTLDYKAVFNEAARRLGLPVFIKPACEGSSFGISKACNFEEFKNGLRAAFEFDRKVIIEETISGFEVGCAVLEREGVLTVGKVDEIEITKDFFDFEEKYTLKDSRIHLPARISLELQEEVKRRAKLAFRALGCSGLARVDMFITDDNSIVLNEINTLPGFTDKSRYPNMLKSIGIEFKDIIEALIKAALDRRFTVTR